MHRLAFPHGRVVFVQGLLVARGIPVDQRVRGIARRPCTEKVDEAVIGIKEGKAFLSTSRPDLEFGYKTGQIVIGDAFFRLCLYEIRDIGEHAVDNRDTVHRLFRKSPDDFDPYTAAALHGHRANKLIRRFAMFQSRFDEFPHGFIGVGKG